MKPNFLFYTKLLFIAVLICGVFVGCGKDNDDSSSGKITYQGESFEIIDATQINFGKAGNGANIDLYLETEAFLLYFEMFVAEGKTKLVAGEYSLNDNYSPFTFSCGGIVYSLVGDTSEDIELEIISGKVDVSVSGDKYTINANVKLQGNNTITAQYTGQIAVMSGNLIYDDTSASAKKAASLK